MDTLRQVISTGRDKLLSGFKYVYSDVNPSTLTGAIDIIVIRQADGTFRGGPFHVRFGKIRTLKPENKIVSIRVNDRLIEYFHMKLDKGGEAYFVGNNKDQSLEALPCSRGHEDAPSAPSVNNIRSISLGNNVLKEPLKYNQTEAEFDQSGYDSDGAVHQITKDSLRNNSNKTHSKCRIKSGGELKPNLENPSPGEGMVMDGLCANSNNTHPKYHIKAGEELKRGDFANPSSRIKDMNEDTVNTDDKETGSLSAMVYQLRLSLCGEPNGGTITEDKFSKHLVSFEDFTKNPDEILENPKLVVLLNGVYHNWAVAAPILAANIAFKTRLPLSTIDRLMKECMPEKSARTTWFGWGSEKLSPTKVQTDMVTEIPADTVNIGEYNEDSMKRIRLSSDEIADLKLNRGQNEITFSVTTRFQGSTFAHASIYLWHWSDKLIISDVDGTITKSDVLGQVLPLLGRDWTQQNVVKLFNKICDNGYKLIYVSARAIGQSGRTREFLTNITQESLEELPDGPILLSPTSSFQSLHREIIERKPEHFKIECLKDVISLFPDSLSPLYAGFGNRTNDVVAYQSVGVDGSRIFTVDKKGNLKDECGKRFTGYGELFDLVDGIFPHDYARSGVCF